MGAWLCGKGVQQGLLLFSRFGSACERQDNGRAVDVTIDTSHV